MEQKVARIQEIYRRGLQDKLPAEKRQIADELIRRGVVKIEGETVQPTQAERVEPLEQPKEQPTQQPQTTEEYYANMGEQDPEKFEARRAGALKGLTFGQASKLKALGKKGSQAIEEKIYGDTLEPKLPLQEQTQAYREKEQRLQEKYPGQFGVSEMGGAVLSPVGGLVAKGVGSVVKGAGALSKFGKITGTGIIEGAAYDSQNLQDVKEGGLVGGLVGAGLSAVAGSAGLVMKTIKPLISKGTGRVSPKKAEAQSLIRTLKKEGTTPEVARANLQKMQDDGVALIDVVDPRSSIISSIPDRAYEKKTIDTIDNYMNQLNSAGNKAKSEVLDLVSKKKISPTEGAELVGQNAQEVISRQKKIRTANAKPLYEKAKTGFIDANDPILNVPVVKDAIAQARKESLKFGTEGIGSIQGQKDNSIATLHQAKDYLYRKSKDFTDLESANYSKIYGELSNKLKQASPDYKKATDIWAGETKGLEELYKQKGIGNIAKKYEKNDIDGIRSLMDKKNVFKKGISDEEIIRLKKSLPDEQFNAIVRKDLNTLIDESGDAGSNLTTSLFGKGDAERSLKSKRLDLVFTPVQKKGLEKATKALDDAKGKGLDKLKFRTVGGQLQHLQGGKYSVINNLIQTANMLADSPKQREAFVNYLFTQQGQQLLEKIAKGNLVETQSLILQTLPAILTQTQGEE